ncbi:helix-turn-helix transcriptional regulator [Streptomyces amakusaensis]|uniref:Helix-turn-helix transcriptional regulator n=1 Tax=Streptomyces amakusaensis TaxID=67271 RepID=A0ABW0AIR2_9ACTN
MTTTRNPAVKPLRNQPPHPRREELRSFLRSRRARLQPEDVGLPGRGLRRTPGLRREEVAILAGIGTSWYTWLEQGRVIKVSDSVVDSISRVLRLDPAERGYFYRLAGLNPPIAPDNGDTVSPPELKRLLDAWSAYPAYVLDRWWNYAYTNSAAQAVFGVPPSGKNCLELFFTDPKYRSFLANWRALAPQVVADFRATAALYPDDGRFTALQLRLYQQSPEFARLWDRHDIRSETGGTKAVVHPVLGEVTFDHLVMHPADRQDLRIAVHLPRDADTHLKLERLLRGNRP